MSSDEGIGKEVEKVAGAGNIAALHTVMLCKAA
jgi:hypothetical protein